MQNFWEIFSFLTTPPAFYILSVIIIVSSILMMFMNDIKKLTWLFVVFFFAISLLFISLHAFFVGISQLIILAILFLLSKKEINFFPTHFAKIKFNLNTFFVTSGILMIIASLLIFAKETIKNDEYLKLYLYSSHLLTDIDNSKQFVRINLNDCIYWNYCNWLLCTFEK
jgi:NADH:ubiquinone oxidoreductase subunit 6 (subunit J)